MITKKYRAGSNGESVSNQQLFMAALDMDGQSETNKSPASTQHAGLFLEGASSPSHKKRHCLSAMSLFASSHKKRHCLSAMSPFGVPGRTRTVDIQNHKQVVELPRTPVSIGVSALLRFAFASILRRISAEL